MLIISCVDISASEGNQHYYWCMGGLQYKSVRRRLEAGYYVVIYISIWMDNKETIIAEVFVACLATEDGPPFFFSFATLRLHS